MSQPYIGEIRLFGGNFAPQDWMFCDGQLLPIAQYDALFNLIGTTYGGDGQTTFALPNLTGRLPMHMGQGSGLSLRSIGELAGTETVTLTLATIPSHTHLMGASDSPGLLSVAPEGAVPAANRDHARFDSGNETPMAVQSLQPSGGSQPHDNMPPYLCVNFIIALFGIFPSPN
jgi:microcystin-dependent protein